MSQEDRATPGGALRDDPCVFLDQQQRSCRCAGLPSSTNSASSLQSQDRAGQSSLEPPDVDGFVADAEDPPEAQREQHRHADIGFERFSGSRTSALEVQAVTSGVDFAVDGENRFARGSQKITSRGPGDESSGKGEPDSDAPEVESPSEENLERHPSGGPKKVQSRKDRLQFGEDSGQDRSAIEPGGRPSDRGSPPIVRNDDRPGTAASSVSFATSLSSNEANGARVQSRPEVHGSEGHNRSQGSNVHGQLPVANGFDNGRSNLRLTRDNNRANVDGSAEVEEIHRVPATPGSVGPTYSPGFRGLHDEHILQPGHRQSNAGLKGTFDTIQVSASNTLEKGKCQCHRIQQHQHQHQQRLPNVQQREQLHAHHHHQHRHKLMQQQQQQQQSRAQSQQQQQQYRHHHYHHPHQHIGQQQDLRRQQNDQLVGRNKHVGAGPEDDSGETTETGPGTRHPPALPPRPPPRPSRRYEQNAIAAYDLGPNNGEDGGCCKKYVVLCCLCGGLSAAVGSLFLAVHAVLSAHTASLALFETVPSYIPGSMLILMGLFTILLARRKHRYGFLMKMCGSIGVVCALVCVLVTVTTTVVHMSRLQGLRECIYTKIARSCTCYGVRQGKAVDPAVLFEGTPHCEVVHGTLYDCLRALFGVSVAGILACIFSCMLLYQLLSHEKKKMYWEQLQLRCRSLYGQGGSGAAGGTAGGSCGCCNDCGGASPWWAQTPGNLYTPNPDLAPFSRRWRLPWSRSRGPAPTPDSNYGFHTQSRGAIVTRSSGSSGDAGDNNAPGPYSVLADESQTGAVPYSLLNGSSNAPYAACSSSVASYSLLENGPLPALWGPPPPYSDPNSPARRPQLTEDRRPPNSARPPPPTAPSSAPVNVSANRIAGKRTIDNFETGSCEEYRQRGTPKRPSDNYENAEEVLSSGTDQDMEMGNLHQHHQHHHHPQHQQDEDTVKGRRIRKSLKGVENSGFQQEPGNGLSKQSESELYFGDVSSCCGPESSFYDLALEKEQQSGPEPGDSLLEYPTPSRLGKQRQPSKRSRLPLPLPALNSEGSVASLTDSYSAHSNPAGVEEVGRNSSTRGPFLAPDAQYEVIAQQTRYTYYNQKNGEHVLEIPLPSLASLAYRNSSKDQLDELDQRQNGGDYLNDCQRVAEHCPVDGASSSTTVAPSPSPSDSSLPPSPVSHSSNATQRCPAEPGGTAIRDGTWQADQTRSQSTELVCPVNV